MKVLSIDLDYIIGPCIETYQRLQWDENPITRWDFLYENTDFRESHLYIDQAGLLFCYQTFLRALEQSPDANVCFGYEHDEILFQLQDHEDIHVINIDHHDDVMASDFEEYDDNLERELKTIQFHDRVHEGNWGAWLHVKEKLSSFTWICNPNSGNLNRNEFNASLLGDKYNVFDRQEYQFYDYKFDQIFVCLSPQYIPKNHWHYFTMFMIAYEQYTDKKVNTASMGKRKFEQEIRHNQVTNAILYQRPNGG